MSRLLFCVAESFAIAERGLILVPGIVPRGDERFRVGTIIELRRGDGTILQSRIAGLEIMSPRTPDGTIPILLPQEVTKDDVPIGTEVWSVD